ncbi:hypothetical protein WA026_015835 [Henosepilachna vigintioctopunctata]|uniref:Gustatory receptor n=1 Tax=Henosepilachna vigintioctopunctata TaxID=420089 RepID=A0AAW1V0N3_9CUCU
MITGSRFDRISSLLKVHSFIFNAVISINDCFGYPLLFIMISCLLHLVVTPFFLITGPQRKPLFVLLQVCWILVHLGRLLIIVEPTHRCIQEHEKTNPLIVHLLSIVEEQEMRRKLEVFATQGQLCVIHFSLCGIVTIRRSLLASIASAVTTYLVIMIQLNE